MAQEREEKKLLRGQILRRRDSMDRQTFLQLNDRLWDRLKGWERLWSQPAVYAYASFRNEADTWRLLQRLWKLRIRTALPRVLDRKKGIMKFFYVQGPEDLKPGCWGIYEPLDSCGEAAEPRALMIMPGAAFGPQGSRIGYGGGYYDRFLEREPFHPTAALAYEFQVLDRIPQEPEDRPMDEIWTPDGRIDCRAMRGNLR